jgi:hypothetical protein
MLGDLCAALKDTIHCLLGFTDYVDLAQFYFKGLGFDFLWGHWFLLIDPILSAALKPCNWLTRDLHGDKARPARKFDNITAIYEQRIWDSVQFPTLLASRACCRDSFTLFQPTIWNVQLDTQEIILTIFSLHVGFEVFTAVTKKNGVFLDVMPCGSCKNRRFGGT